MRQDFLINYNSFILSIAIIFFSSCSSPKPKESYPSWFYSSQDNGVYYYGSGEGNTKNIATIQALNDIASKISTSIESSIVATTNSNGKNYSKTITQNIKNEVQKIDFHNYEVLKLKKINNKNIILLRINKKETALFKLDKLKLKIKTYKQAINSNLNIIHKLKNLKTINKKIQHSISQAFIIKSLYKSKDIDNQIHTLMSLQVKIKSFKNNTSFYIASNDDYSRIISENILSSGFKIKKSSKSIIIKTKITQKKIRLMGYFILKVKVNISIYHKNNLISTKIINAGAKSSTSYKQAREFAIIDFKKKMVDFLI